MKQVWWLSFVGGPEGKCLGIVITEANSVEQAEGKIKSLGLWPDDVTECAGWYILEGEPGFDLEYRDQFFTRDVARKLFDSKSIREWESS